MITQKAYWLAGLLFVLAVAALLAPRALLAQPCTDDDPACLPLTVNVPVLVDLTEPSALDANNWAIVRFGTISPAGGMAQVRLIGAPDGLRIYAQLMTPTVHAGDALTLTVRDLTLAVAYPDTPGWTIGARCEGDACRGWSAEAKLPWAQLGGAPAPGDRWPVTLEFGTATWRGDWHWGLPDYRGQTGTFTRTVPVAADATLGGSTDCGDDDAPAYFPTWGSRSYARDPKYRTFTNIQAQWDTADWPCYSAYIARWTLPKLPAGAKITGAWLDLWRFGHAGYAPGDTLTTTVQVFAVSPNWDAAGVTWDNAPPAIDAVSRTDVHECSDAECGRWYAFDVTEIVRRALAQGDRTAAALLYTAAGQYHSGKYFYTVQGTTPPVVRLSYDLPAAGAEVALPTATAALSPSPSTAVRAQATPSVPPTASPTPLPAAPVRTAPATPPAGSATSATGRTYYVGLRGSDNAPGTAQAPWRTFAHAWTQLRPGDTLLILDGTYTEPIQPLVAGTAGKPITIKAVNDGKVVIDGRNQDIPLKLGDNWPGDNRSWFVVEGIVVKRGTEAAIRVRGDHITLRRVSAYDAGLRLNSSVIAVVWSSHILLEDVIAAGTGRKSILIFTSDHVTVRRAFTQWQRWDGQTDDTCPMGWPAGNGINPYNSQYVIVENAIVTGPVADAGLRITINDASVYSPGMQVLGSIAAGAGLNADGSVHEYTLPPKPECALPSAGPPYTAAGWGLGVYGQGDAPGPIFRDVLAIDNAGWGFANLKPSGVGAHDGILDHATLLRNNLYPGQPSEQDVQGTYAGFTVTNSNIPGYQQGAGARLTHRYVDGVLTDEPLWPWPMESRAQAELSISVTKLAQGLIDQAATELE